MHTEFYIVGDFNLHMDTPSATTTAFNDILISFDPKQHVNFPTHTKVKVEVCFYIAQSLGLLKALLTLLPWQTCLIKYHLNFSGPTICYN